LWLLWWVWGVGFFFVWGGGVLFGGWVQRKRSSVPKLGKKKSGTVKSHKKDKKKTEPLIKRDETKVGNRTKKKRNKKTKANNW